jgi:hypothetical protein
MLLVTVAILSSACAGGQPAGGADAARQLSPESRRRLNTLTIIIDEANGAKDPGKRQRLLGEFLDRSRSFVEANPWHTNIWVLRASAALELGRADEGAEAGRKLLEFKLDDSGDAKARKVVTALDRKGWLDNDAPAQLGEKVTTPFRTSGIVVTRENPFVNSLGMKFVSVPGVEPLFCIWLTRVQDYAAYADANPAVDGSWRNPMFEGVPVTPGRAHPVVNVNWNDSRNFCLWLTRKDRREGKISEGARYRMPTDEEWSRAAGLGDREGNGTPEEKGEKLLTIYPWGPQWPPPAGAGNYSDSATGAAFVGFEIIPGYQDGFPTTSPVGSFKDNLFGLYDMSGNVWEWCEDWYNREHKLRILRGASWNSRTPKYLSLTYRTSRPHADRLNVFGFRCVLEGMPPAGAP